MTRRTSRPSGFKLDLELLVHASILLASALVLTATWFRGDSLIIYGDHDFAPDRVRPFLRTFFSWDDTGLGSFTPRVLVGPLPYEALRLIGSWAGLTVSQSQKLWLFLFHAAAGLGMYYLFTCVYPGRSRRLAALFAACFYIVNPMKSYVLVLPITGIYASMPLKLGLFITGLRKKKGPRYAIGMALLWMLITNSDYANPVFVIVDWAPLLLYLIWHVLLCRDAASRRHAGRFTFFLAGVQATLNIYWLMPIVLSIPEQVSAADLSVYATSAVQAFRQNTLSMMNALRVMLNGLETGAANYRGEPYDPWGLLYGSPAGLCASFLIPFLAFVTLLRRRRHRDTVYFSFLGAVGVLLVSGPHSLAGSFMEWLWGSTPVGTFFRFPLNKFGPYVLAAYAVLMGAALVQAGLLVQQLANRAAASYRFRMGRIRLGQLPLVIGFVLIVGLYSWPYWLGDIIRLSNGSFLPAERVKIPSYYYDAAGWLQSSAQDYRLGLFPTGVGYSFLRWQYGLTGLNPGRWLFERSLYALRTKGYSEVVEPASPRWLDLGGVFRLLNIQYFVFQNDVDWESVVGNPWVDYISPSQFRDLMRSQAGITFERRFGELDLYRLSEPLPHIYTSPNAMVVLGDISMSALASTGYLEASPPPVFFSETQDDERENSEAGAAPNRPIQDQEQRRVTLLAPETTNDAMQSVSAVGEEDHVARIRISPRIWQDNIHLLPKQTDWRVELANGDWQIAGIEPPAALPGLAAMQPPLHFYGSGWYDEERDHRIGWRWGVNDMSLLILNPNPRALLGTLSLPITSIRERDLEVTMGDQVIRSIHLPANYDQIPRILLVDALRERIYAKPVYPFPYEARFPEDWTAVTLEKIVLHPGVNEIVLHTPQGTDIMNDLLGNGDLREVSVQLWDGVEFEIEDLLEGGHSQEIGPVANVQYKKAFVDNQLALDLDLDGDEQEQEYTVISREFPGIDLEEYPLCRFSYAASDPSVMTVDAAFGIDWTDDGHADGYVTAHSFPADNGKKQQINLNVFEAAKERFPDPYYLEGHDLRLVSTYLIPHKPWNVDVTDRAGTYEVKFGDFNLYNDHSVILPIDGALRSEAAQARWQMIAATGDLSMAQVTGSAYQKLPYPTKTVTSDKLEAQLAELLSMPLVKIDGQPIPFRLPTDQVYLLDQNGYWLASTSVTLAAGPHNVEVVPHPTFQVDLIEVANRPYRQQGPTAHASFRKVNPTRYNLTVDAWDDSWLVFSESFHLGWKAYVVSESSASAHPWYEWSALLTWLAERDRRIALPDHYLVNGYANGWHIPQTGQYRIVLEFVPQRLFELGVLVSAASLLGCLGVLAAYGLRRRRA